MAAVEIEESELAQYRGIAQTLQAWMSNPKARKKILEARKEIDPNAIIPELDAAAPINEAMSKLDEKLMALDKKLSDDAAAREQSEKMSKLNSQWESGRVKLRSSGYTEEGIKKVEELMEKEGIANHEAGAAYYDRLNPPEEPLSPSSGSGFDMLMGTLGAANTDDAMKASQEALFKNPDQWADNIVREVHRDFNYGKK